MYFCRLCNWVDLILYYNMEFIVFIDIIIMLIVVCLFGVIYDFKIYYYMIFDICKNLYMIEKCCFINV